MFTIAEKPVSISRMDHVQLAMPVGKENAARDFYEGLLVDEDLPQAGISFFTYLGDRLGLNTDCQKILPLAELIAAPA